VILIWYTKIALPTTETSVKGKELEKEWKKHKCERFIEQAWCRAEEELILYLLELRGQESYRSLFTTTSD